MGLPWFRMYARFVTDPDVEELSFEDQRHYVFLLCLKCSGLLDKEFSDPEKRERAISRRLGLQGEALTFAKERLVASGLVGQDWQPRNWNALQFASDSSTERVREFRKRSGNVSVTAQIRTDQTRTEKKEGLKAVSSEAIQAFKASLPTPNDNRHTPEQLSRIARTKT